MAFITALPLASLAFAILSLDQVVMKLLKILL